MVSPVCAALRLDDSNPHSLLDSAIERAREELAILGMALERRMNGGDVIGDDSCYASVVDGIALRLQLAQELADAKIADDAAAKGAA